MSFVLPAVLALGLALAVRGRTGLEAALPWAGALFYGLLAGSSLRRPNSAWIPGAVSFAVFVHASLLGEMAFQGRFCLGCAAVAAAAGAAVVARLRRHSAERLGCAAALVLGALSGMFTPFERLDYVAKRALHPGALLAGLPSFVAREEVLACAHGREARLILYEKDCKG